MSLLQQLLALHKVDVQVRSLRSRLSQADRYLDALEEQTLAQIERSEQVGKRLTDMEPLLAERTRRRDEAKVELDQRRADSAERLGELDRERAAAAAGVPAETMGVFDEVADLHEGEAMSEVEVIDARHREYACSACNTEIPLAIYARLAGDTGKVVQCVSCKRILHMAATAVAEAAEVVLVEAEGQEEDVVDGDDSG